ncbi:MAG: phytoene desaturase [Gammaproteobacteria bacterium]|nr:phytoene desaturase [Gammaproteobacteria bacterium]
MRISAVPEPHVVVVGAGMAGLVAALELSRRGAAVRVIERASGPGGKMRQVPLGGQQLDAGPTVLTMRWVFDELFDAAGSALADHVRLAPAELLARHAWSADERLDLYADLAASTDAIGAFAGAAEARRFRAFCARARSTFEALEHSYMRAARPTPVSLVRRAGLRGLPGLMKISPFATLWDALGEYFHDPRLRQLFGRYATYCGASPYAAPATLMLIAHVELAGVWRPLDGMHSLALAIAALAARHGAEFHYDCEVRDITTQQGRTSGVHLDDGRHLAADAVVFNGDVAALAGGLLGADARKACAATTPAQRSLSAITWTMCARTAGFDLSHHNVFFSDDYAAEFTDIFTHGRLPRTPTVYICAQDRGADASPGPQDAERLLCLVNAPALGDRDTPTLNAAEIERCEERTFQRLADCGLALSPQAAATLRTTPSDWAALFPATGGALYGQASHGWRTSFSRPGAHSRLPGLYLAGGSVHPGPGVPMAALSGRLAATALWQDLTSRGR